MEIRADRYRIHCDLTTMTVVCEGALLLSGVEEYHPILQLLKEMIDQQPNKMTIDLRELKYLNSSGINMFARFAMYAQDKKQPAFELTMMGKKQIYWHERIFKNLKRLLPTLTVELD
ncbi:MAG: hypothetical protein BWK79_15095 [Beggiatoa sp. IS2]|nr:MAG: hypothetical protein BWK79_15095 [Beggiatoa sp. IS2]